ncbi:hypothetical protein ACFO3J_31440 [Streptomyces polygonati]|uniref:Uncharacterized protein n=1 Tax=Streptomyces polygonati TaxID=1617087 RepID=A0ABV8HV66_9ACTN
MSPRSTRRKGASALEVSGGDGVFVVHPAGPLPDRLADAARALTGASGVAGQVTVLVGAGFDDPDALCDELAPAFDTFATSGVGLLRLVMSGGAAERPDRAAPARRITERWTFDVLAPAGAAVVVPGGTLFAPDLPDAPGAWWQFSRGLLPRRLGARHPEPAWQQALDRVAADTAPGCVVHHVPAGLLVLPAGVPPEGVDAVRYALPVDPAGPVLLVGAAGTAPVPADALADIMAALPAHVRGTVRLLPGDGRDLAPTGQQVADLLGIEVQVANGLPVLLDDGSAPAGSPWDRPIRGGSPRTMLLDAEGNPSWRPYVEAVTCVPATTAPRLTGWRPPIGGLRPAREPGALLLDRHWQVAVTRAGLWIGPQGAAVPAVAADRPVEPDVMAVDLGLPGRPLDDATLWVPLQRLFAALQDDVRERTMIQVHGEATGDALRELRRLAVRHGLAVSPRGWRPVVAGVGPSGAGAGAGSGAGSEAGSASASASAERGGAVPVPRPTATGGTSAGAAASGLPSGSPSAREESPGRGIGDAAGTGPVSGRERRRPWRSAAAGTSDTSDTSAPVAGGEAGTAAAGDSSGDSGGSGGSGAEVPAVSGASRLAVLSGPGAGSLAPGSAAAASGAADRLATTVGGLNPGQERELSAADLASDGSTQSAVGAEIPSVAASGLPPAQSPLAEPTPTPTPPAARQPKPVDPPAAAGSVPTTPESGPPGAEPAPEAPAPQAAARPPEQGVDPHPVGESGTAAGTDPSQWEPVGEPSVMQSGPTAPEPAAPLGPFAPEAGAPEAADPASTAETLAVLPEPEAPRPLATTSGASDSVELPVFPAPLGVEQHVAETTAADPTTPAPSAEPEAPRGGGPSGLRTVGWVPVGPAHRSTEDERDAVRAYMAGRWDHHSGAVNRALTRVPALRSAAHPEEAAADLAALHAYATASDSEGPWAHRALRASLDGGSTELVAFLGCLASGLRRLPSYRGAAVRPAGGALGEAAELLLPGEELGDALPLSAVAVDKGYPSVPADHYLIWSMTGRRVNSLLGQSESGAVAVTGTSAAPDEVLFAPGTRLRVLAVADRAGATVVLLRELPSSAPPTATPGQLDDSDQAVLKRLYALKDQPTAVGSGQHWPERCAGVLGVFGPSETPPPGRTTTRSRSS